jgi:hypothetical protein
MVNALIGRTTAGSDYWIIIISLCHYNQERKDVYILPLAFFLMLFFFVVIHTRKRQDTNKTYCKRVVWHLSHKGKTFDLTHLKTIVE